MKRAVTAVAAAETGSPLRDRIFLLMLLTLSFVLVMGGAMVLDLLN